MTNLLMKVGVPVLYIKGKSMNRQLSKTLLMNMQVAESNQIIIQDFDVIL